MADESQSTYERVEALERGLAAAVERIERLESTVPPDRVARVGAEGILLSALREIHGLLAGVNGETHARSSARVAQAVDRAEGALAEWDGWMRSLRDEHVVRA